MTERTLEERLRDEWRCFHCDVVFTDHEEAEKHFGTRQYDAPLCIADKFELEATRKERDEYGDIRAATLGKLFEAQKQVDAKSALLAEAVTALEHMLFHFGNPQRDEWLNDQAFESAKGADANARSVLAKLKAAQE